MKLRFSSIFILIFLFWADLVQAQGQAANQSASKPAVSASTSPQSSSAKSGTTPNTSASAEATSPLRRADVISVKAALEDMLVRRYAQELSAIVSYERFNVGARFDLIVVDDKEDKRNAKAQDNYTDLDLGYLDADTLFDRYSNIESGTVSPLAKYAIKAVSINVGIQENMGEQIKKSVDDWLQARVKDEFGGIGKAQVQFIQSENSNPTLLDRVIQMQGLVGQLILAIAILLGVILWKLLSGGSSKTEPLQSSVNIESKTEMKAGEGVFGSGSAKSADLDLQKSLELKIDQLSFQIKDLAPKLVDHLEMIISQWSEQGEEGLMQIAGFAEISGSVLGSLPIPKEHKKKMGDVFAQMSALSLDKRHDVTNKIYWDLVASLNLGSDALNRPFSFLGNTSLGTVNQVLLGNNADIQTVVSLYMPEAMRKNYFSKLDNDKKVELLNTAAKLSTISQDRLKDIENQIAPYFDQKIDDAEVSLSMTLNKLIDSMTFMDACRLMSKVKGPMVEEYKIKHPHIGFFSDWTVSSQEILIKKATNEELNAYIRVVPEMSPNVLELVSPRARQILEDDLGRPDNMLEAEKEKLIQSLHNRLLNLVYSNAINLEEAIKKKNDTSGGGLSIAA